MKDNTGFITSKALWQYIMETKKTLFVSTLFHEYYEKLNGGDYIFFDVTLYGKIIGRSGKHTTEMSVGKWVRLIFSQTVITPPIKKTGQISILEFEQVKDRDIELFSNMIAGRSKRENYTIEIWSGWDIKKAFDLPVKLDSRLGKSCMNTHSDYFDMICNCEDVSLVVVLGEGGSVLGRAFLWNCDIGHPIKFMDRFYTKMDYIDDTLIKYCQDNNIYRKKLYYTYESRYVWISPEEKVLNVNASVNIAQDGFKKYPFLDTFIYGGDGYISTSSYGSRYMYQSTDGTRDECMVLS